MLSRVLRSLRSCRLRETLTRLYDLVGPGLSLAKLGFLLLPRPTLYSRLSLAKLGWGWKLFSFLGTDRTEGAGTL